MGNTMRFTTRRRAAVLVAGSALVAGFGVTALVAPATAAPHVPASPATVCGWQPANYAGLRTVTVGQAWIRRGGDTSCGTLIAAGTGDHIEVHCSWQNNVTGDWWDYAHDDERSTTGWLPDSVLAGGSPVTSLRC